MHNRRTLHVITEHHGATATRMKESWVTEATRNQIYIVLDPAYFLKNIFPLNKNRKKWGREKIFCHTLSHLSVTVMKYLT